VLHDALCITLLLYYSIHYITKRHPFQYHKQKDGRFLHSSFFAVYSVFVLGPVAVSVWVLVPDLVVVFVPVSVNGSVNVSV